MIWAPKAPARHHPWLRIERITRDVVGQRLEEGAKPDLDRLLDTVVQPATGLLLAAVAGQGAWMQEGEGPRRRLSLTPGTRRRLATKSWLGAPGNLAALGAVAAALNGSLLQADFSLCPRCFVAPRPPIDAMVGLPAGAPIDAWEWDIATIDLIVREAGGAASDVAGAPLRYNQPEPRFASGLIIAADPVLHRDLVAAFRRSAARRTEGTSAHGKARGDDADAGAAPALR